MVWIHPRHFKNDLFAIVFFERYRTFADFCLIKKKVQVVHIWEEKDWDRRGGNVSGENINIYFFYRLYHAKTTYAPYTMFQRPRELN